MTLADVLASLFPGDPPAIVRRDGGLLLGTGVLPNGQSVAVVGIVDGATLGVDGALTLAGRVLEIVAAGAGTPILVLVDSGSQRMSRRDELLGLSECLAHLAKTLFLASRSGHPTVGLLYGGSAAGAFIATALATRTLLALPGAHPAVMDLPSMAKVTKLSLDRLETMARGTPVFAPGLDNLTLTGAIDAVLDPARSLAEQVVPFLDADAGRDRRGEWGASRGGRAVADAMAARVRAEAGRG